MESVMTEEATKDGKVSITVNKEKYVQGTTSDGKRSLRRDDEVAELLQCAAEIGRASCRERV